MMTSSNAIPEQKGSIVGIIVILLIILTALGAVYWLLTSQAHIRNIDNRQECNPIAFAWGGVVSKLDCLYN